MKQLIVSVLGSFLIFVSSSVMASQEVYTCELYGLVFKVPDGVVLAEKKKVEKVDISYEDKTIPCFKSKAYTDFYSCKLPRSLGGHDVVTVRLYNSNGLLCTREGELNDIKAHAVVP